MRVMRALFVVGIVAGGAAYLYIGRYDVVAFEGALILWFVVAKKVKS